MIMTSKKQREVIYKILKVYDATNKASWWNIADVIAEELKKARLDSYKKGYTKGVMDSENGQITSEELLK